eukprot:PITA_32422
MMRNQEVARRPPLFDGTNFGFWKKRMSYYLMSLGPEVWHSVLNEYIAPSTLPTDQDERKVYVANAKALNSITSGIIDSEFTKVMNCNSGKEVWDKIIGLYDGDSKVKKAKLQTHRRQFESLKMDDEEDIASYFLRVAEVVNSLKGLEENIEESTIVQKVLRLKKGSKLKGKYPLICFKCGKIGHYAAKCPHKHDSDDEENSKRMVYKKKGFNKENFLSKQDESDEDEFVVIKKKSTNQFTHRKGGNEESDEENDHARSQEVLFMAFTNDDDSGLDGNVDELLISAIEENEKLQNKMISLKVENEETKRKEDLLKNKLKEKEESWKEREAEIVSLKKELEQVKKGWKSSQILDTILNNQKPQHDKSGIGFKGES